MNDKIMNDKIMNDKIMNDNKMIDSFPKDIVNIILCYLTINERIAFAKKIKSDGNTEIAYHILLQTVNHLQNQYANMVDSVDKILERINSIEHLLT